MRVIAIDWSGAMTGERRKLWLAEVREHVLVRLECGRSRDELVHHLLENQMADPQLVVGLDFAFSMPAWFVRSRGAASVQEFWRCVESDAEVWLSACQHPFWGRKGSVRPHLEAHFRSTEERARVAGIRAKSVFQVNGGGAVGTGSLRGMPHLLKLRTAGFAVWPFDDFRLPAIVEIYPRLLTGAVVKSSPWQRQRFLANGFPEIPDEFQPVAASSDDAFDAAVSAVVMSRYRANLSQLRRTVEPLELLEGSIWSPFEKRERPN